MVDITPRNFRALIARSLYAVFFEAQKQSLLRYRWCAENSIQEHFIALLGHGHRFVRVAVNRLASRDVVNTSL